MSSIKGRDTLLELNFEKILKSFGLRFKRNVQDLPGKPDVVFRKRKIVIFVDGCFWHGCKKHFSLPKSNKWFWARKIEGNIKRDVIINKFYKTVGWRVFRVWQHDVTKNSKKITKIVLEIKKI